jgi:hypothetical protein
MTDGQVTAHLLEAMRAAARATSLRELANEAMPALGRAFDTSFVCCYRVVREGYDGYFPAGLSDPSSAYTPYAAEDPCQHIKRMRIRAWP